MANLALGWENLADSGTLSASGSVTLAPVSRLLNKHVSRKWRVNASNAYIICDLGALVEVDTVALMGMVGDSPTLQVRISTADTSGASGDAYNSGSLIGAWDSNYLPFVQLIAVPVTGRYVRIDISEGGVGFIEAGRIFVGVRVPFEVNYQAGWERTWHDPSVRTIGRSGLTFDDLRNKYRGLNLTFELMPEDDRWDITEAVDLALGTTGDMLVITDTASTNPSRDSLWGYIEESDPVIEPVIVADGPRFRRTYRLRERL